MMELSRWRDGPVQTTASPAIPHLTAVILAGKVAHGRACACGLVWFGVGRRYLRSDDDDDEEEGKTTGKLHWQALHEQKPPTTVR
eukprot:evm.model.NODE_50220_length_46951_cov_42.727013.2